MSTTRGHQRRFGRTSVPGLTKKRSLPQCQLKCQGDADPAETHVPQGGLIGHMTKHEEAERSPTCTTGLQRSGSQCRCPWRAWSAGICCLAGGWLCGPAKLEHNYNIIQLSIYFFCVFHCIVSLKSIWFERNTRMEEAFFEGFFFLKQTSRCGRFWFFESGTNKWSTTIAHRYSSIWHDFRLRHEKPAFFSLPVLAFIHSLIYLTATNWVTSV